ncbi:MAG TPA: DUF4166 domain-containing protein [Burkholderiales bacterium]|nr:DUF4166 domain-containing protein [Burkholderiales bacterium]
MSVAVETWFGDAFELLHPSLQALHRSGGTLSGTVDVRLGAGLAGWIGRRLARQLGIPARDGAMPMSVSIYGNEKELHWDRTFNEAYTFTSTFTPSGSYPYGHWIESSGRLRLNLGVSIVNGGWIWRPMGGRLWGIPIPILLLPRTSASKRIEGGLYQFNVDVGLPLLGTALSYSGKLVLEPLHQEKPLVTSSSKNTQ